MEQTVKKLEFMLNQTTDIIIELDSRAVILYANAKALQFFSQQWMTGRSLWEFLSPEPHEQIQQGLSLVLKQQKPLHQQIKLKRRYFKVSAFPLSTSTVFLNIHDEEDGHAISRSLKKTAERLEFAERIAKLGYWEINLKSRTIYWSAEMFRIFGIDARKVSCKRNIIREQVIPEDLPIYKQKLKELLSTGETIEGQLRIYRHNQKKAYCQFKASLISDENGPKIAGTFQDITALVEIQLALENARKQAEKLSYAKSYFLAQASHDLRQPMQALNIFIDHLREEKLYPGARQLVDKIAASADNLKALLDNFLDISKLESGGVEYHPLEFDLRSLISKLGHEFSEIALSQHIDFYYNSAAVKVYSDPLLIERVLRNLLSNAFKYNHGKILMGARKLNNFVRIFVMDNGNGISPEDLPHLFDEFYQSPQDKEKRSQGAGLGLSIVKKISQLLNTEVKVSSNPGHSVCFYFDLHIIKTGHF